MPTPRKKKKRVSRKRTTKAKKAPDTTQAAPETGEDAVKSDDLGDNKTGKNKAGKNTMRTTGRKKTTRNASRRRVPARRKAKNSGDTSNAQTIHCTLALTGSTSIVLPTSTIAEITDYAPPAPLDDTPDWLLGQVEWEDWQVPVISYDALIGGAEPETATGRSRIMVVKSLSNTARVPYIGVLVREIPKLAKLSEAELEVIDQENESPSVHCTVKMSRKTAVIPDLERLAQLVGHAAYGTIEKSSDVAQV